MKEKKKKHIYIVIVVLLHYAVLLQIHMPGILCLYNR